MRFKKSVWTGLTSVSEKRVVTVGITGKEKYKDVHCLNLIWVKKVKRKTQLSDWHVLLIIMLEILPAEYMYMYPHEPVSRVLAPVVQTLDSAIHRINHYPADSVIDFRNTYPLDRDLSGG